MVLGRGRKLWGEEKEEEKEESGRKGREMKEKGSGTSKPELGRNWSLSIAVTPAYTWGVMRYDLLNEGRICALWVAMEFVVTYNVCDAHTHMRNMCAWTCSHTHVQKNDCSQM